MEVIDEINSIQVDSGRTVMVQWKKPSYVLAVHGNFLKIRGQDAIKGFQQRISIFLYCK